MQSTICNYIDKAKFAFLYLINSRNFVSAAYYIFNSIRSSLFEEKNAHVSNRLRRAAAISGCNRELRYVTRSSLTKIY